MTQPESDTSLPDQRASRRKFFKFMAASPLAALAYAAWPSRLLEQVAAEVPSGPPMTPAPLPCVNCGAPVLPPEQRPLPGRHGGHRSEGAVSVSTVAVANPADLSLGQDHPQARLHGLGGLDGGVPVAGALPFGPDHLE